MECVKYITQSERVFSNSESFTVIYLLQNDLSICYLCRLFLFLEKDVHQWNPLHSNVQLLFNTSDCYNYEFLPIEHTERYVNSCTSSCGFPWNKAAHIAFPGWKWSMILFYRRRSYEVKSYHDIFFMYTHAFACVRMFSLCIHL